MKFSYRKTYCKHNTIDANRIFCSFVCFYCLLLYKTASFITCVDKSYRNSLTCLRIGGPRRWLVRSAGIRPTQTRRSNRCTGRWAEVSSLQYLWKNPREKLIVKVVHTTLSYYLMTKWVLIRYYHTKSITPRYDRRRTRAIVKQTGSGMEYIF